MFENVRRVVTVIDENGVSRIESDGPPALTRRLPHAGAAIDEVWKFDAVPGDIHAPGDPSEFAFLSPPSGFLVRRVEVPPDSVRFVDEAGKARVPERHEGMHQTPTIDILQILEGELWLLLDSGEETLLRAGDVVVQRGTVHAWRNRSDTPMRYLAIMVSAPLPNPIEHPANP
jgi:mannose-6-phosphate isomerase-like protein (cupin superfamily)